MSALPGRWPAALLAAVLLGGAAAADGGRSISEPYTLSPHVAVGQTYMGMRLLGSVVLDSAPIDGQPLGGLSGLAWDEDDARLYALSDRGRLFHLRPRFEGGRLVGVDVAAVYRLRDAAGRPLQGRRADAEALVARRTDNAKKGDSLLAVAFERDPRISHFTATGRFVDARALPAQLRDESRYAAPNKSLESLAWLPHTGYVTAPERPLAGAAPGIIDIFALDGRRWRYPLADTPNASLVAMEALPDGSLLTLERGHGLMYLPIINTLRVTRLGATGGAATLAVTSVAVLDSSLGWSVDNFEGLARRRGLEFFMVSDDNFNELQKSLLVYFSLTGTGDAANPGNVPDFELRQETRD